MASPLDKFCVPFDWNETWSQAAGIPRCQYGFIVSNFYLLASLYFTFALCCRKYSSYEALETKITQRGRLVTFFAGILSIWKIVGVIVELVHIWKAFIPFIFLPAFLLVKNLLSMSWLIRKSKAVPLECVVFTSLNLALKLFAIAGWKNNSEWFFGSDGRRLEFYLWLVDVVLSSMLFLATILPSPAVEQKIFPDGRRFVPSESRWSIQRFAHNFRYMWSYAWPRSLRGRSSLVACFIIMIATRVCNVFMPYYSKLIIDQLTQHLLDPTEFHDVAVTVGILVVFKLITGNNGLMNQLKGVLYISVEQEAERFIQVTMFSHLHHLPYQWHVKRKTGEILRNVDRGSSAIMNLLNWICFNIGPTLLDVLIAVFYFAFMFNWIFAVLVLSCMVVYLAATVAITEWRTKFRKTMIAQNNSQNARAIDSLLNYEQVKMNGNEDYERDLYDEKIANVQIEERKVQYSLTVLNTVQNVVNAAGFCIGSLLAVHYVIEGSFTVGDFVLFGTYMAQLYTPLNFLGTYYRIIQNAFVDTENLLELLGEKPEPKEPETASALDSAPVGLGLESVTFQYQGDERRILNSLNFNVPPGETWALVGASGSGKSTIARLMTGLVTPSEGTVLVNGNDLEDVGRKRVRRAIGSVSQDCTLFNESLRENVRYSKLEATDEEIENAIRLAGLDLSKWKDGLDTNVGERGLALSGGEKQRIAIARLILKRPNAVILDEATSSLDTITEKQVHHELIAAAKGKTCLMIAHRLSTVIHADKILVIESGNVIELGTHQELLAQKGKYSELWEEQIRDIAPE